MKALNTMNISSINSDSMRKVRGHGTLRLVPSHRNPRQMSAAPTAHRKPPQYKQATAERAFSVVATLNECGAIRAGWKNSTTVAVWAALDDARSAGFAAGVAFARSRGL